MGLMLPVAARRSTPIPQRIATESLQQAPEVARGMRADALGARVIDLQALTGTIEVRWRRRLPI